MGGLGEPPSPVESLASMQSLPGSLSSSSLSHAAPLGELSPELEDSPTTLCSFFPKMANLKLSNPANLLSLRGSSAGSSPGEPGPPGMPALVPGGAASPSSARPVPVCPQDMNKLSCGKKTRVEGGQLGGDEWTRHGSFVNKPTRGWLHPDEKVMGSGVSYHVRVSAEEWERVGRVTAGIWGPPGGRMHRALCGRGGGQGRAMGSGVPREVGAAELGCLRSQRPPWLHGRRTPWLAKLTLLSCTVHGLCGSAPVHEGSGFQHQDTGHQVSSAFPQGLLLLGRGEERKLLEPHTCPW